MLRLSLEKKIISDFFQKLLENDKYSYYFFSYTTFYTKKTQLGLVLKS